MAATFILFLYPFSPGCFLLSAVRNYDPSSTNPASFMARLRRREDHKSRRTHHSDLDEPEDDAYSDVGISSGSDSDDSIHNTRSSGASNRKSSQGKGSYVINDEADGVDDGISSCSDGEVEEDYSPNTLNLLNRIEARWQRSVGLLFPQLCLLKAYKI